MLGFHREAFLFVIQSHKIVSTAIFVIAYAVILGLYLPSAAITSFACGFLFGITFGTKMNIGAATLGAMALYLVVRWGTGDIFVHRLDGLEESRINCVSPW